METMRLLIAALKIGGDLASSACGEGGGWRGGALGRVRACLQGSCNELKSAGVAGVFVEWPP